MQRYAITSGETLDLTILLGETPGPAPLLRTPRQRKNVTLFLLKRRGRGHGQGAGLKFRLQGPRAGT